MPTYIYDPRATATLKVTNPDGKAIKVPPGSQFESKDRLNRSDLTLVLSAPFSNKLLTEPTVTFAGAESKAVPIDMQTEYIAIHSSTVDVVVFQQDESNTPELVTIQTTTGKWSGAMNTEDAEQLVLVSSGAGTIEVLQSEEEIKVS